MPVTTLNQPVLNSPADAATGQGQSVSLSWTDTNTSPNEAGYRVRIKTSGGSYQYHDFAPDATSGSATTALGTLLGFGVTYYWSVEALGNGGVTTNDSGYPADRSFTAAVYSAKCGIEASDTPVYTIEASDSPVYSIQSSDVSKI